MQMKISEIKINPGRRDTQQRNVEELARSIAAVGLMNPITITQDNTLIAGLHRLEAVSQSLNDAGLFGPVGFGGPPGKKSRRRHP